MPAQRVVSKAVERLAQKCDVCSASVEDAYPCTTLQAALLTASLHGLAKYVSRFVFDLSSSNHDQGVVHAACELLYKQNPILRSRFVESKGQFFQVVVQEPLKWCEGNDVHDYLTQDSEKAVLLGQPLARFGWIQEPQGRAYAIWSFHHAIYDEWSFDLMIQDLNKYIQNPAERIQRPTFSKFVKAIGKVDQNASHNFWRTNLDGHAKCRKICPNVVEDVFRTSKASAKSYTVELSPGLPYRLSELAVCAYTFLLAHLSASPNILFGNIMNGRTLDVAGIQQICGPTLATVPFHCDVTSKVSIAEYLDTLRQLRLQILPYEQTGLVECRKLTGTAAFDTLLSVRAVQNDSSSSSSVGLLQPDLPTKMDLSHPCLLYFEADFTGGVCKLKASYDERWIDAQPLGTAMDAFIRAIETIPWDLETTVGDFIHSMQLPQSIELPASDIDQPREAFTEEQLGISSLDPDILDRVKGLAESVAGVKETHAAGAETTLMQLGMDSLKIVLFARQLSDTFGAVIPFKEVAGRGRSLAGIAKTVQRTMKRNGKGANSESGLNLLDLAQRYAERLQSVIAASQEEAASPRSSTILLTGASGYLGIEILRHCLTQRNDDIVLLIRCTSSADGFERILKSARMARWKIAEIEMLERVTIWPSDLSRETLGLSTEHWRLLTDPSSPMKFSSFIHNGAKVDFLQTYDDLEAANVTSTYILLEQHLKFKDPPTFVYVTGGRPCPLEADSVGETAKALADSAGYAQTKFVSEVLVHKTTELHRASGRRCRMSIVHPGVIIGSAGTGVANTDDLVWRYVSASLSMACYVPAVPTKREWINFTPVNTVAAKVMSCAFEAAHLTKDLEAERHLMRAGLPIGQFWFEVINSLGDKAALIEPVSEWEWLAEFKVDVDRKAQEQPLFSLSQLFLEGHIHGIGGLSPAPEAMPGATEIESVKAAIRRNLEYLASIGHFSDLERGGRSYSMAFSRGKT